MPRHTFLNIYNDYNEDLLKNKLILKIIIRDNLTILKLSHNCRSKDWTQSQENCLYRIQLA